MDIKQGSIDQSLDVVLRKTADNTELTGVAYTSATAYYWRQGGTPTAITLSALAAVNSTHADGGWKEADATNMPGSYRLDVPDAAFASGAAWVEINVKVSTAYVWKERYPLVANIASDLNSILTNGSYGLAQLVRSTTPANTLTVNASGQIVISGTAANAITSSSLATDSIGSAQLAATAISEIQSGLATSSALTSVASEVSAILVDTGTSGVIVATNNDKTGYGLASGAVNTTSLADGTLTAAKIGSDAITAAKVAADVTTEIQSGLATAASLTTVGGNVTTLLSRVPDTISLAAINSQVDTALADYDAPTKTEMDAAFTQIKGATWSSTDTLEAIRDRGDAAWYTPVGFSTFNPGTDTVTLADSGITATKIASDAANKIADHVLRRSFATAEASADGDTKNFRSLLGAGSKQVNKVSQSGTTLTIYQTNDTTALGTQTLTLDTGAAPIVGVDTD